MNFLRTIMLPQQTSCKAELGMMLESQVSYDFEKGKKTV